MLKIDPDHLGNSKASFIIAWVFYLILVIVLKIFCMKKRQEDKQSLKSRLARRSSKDYHQSFSELPQNNNERLNRGQPDISPAPLNFER